jgi:GDP-4-dehydro-6-deoxy-D-mannose reductase
MKKKRLMIIGGNSFVARHFRDYVIKYHENELEQWLSVDRDLPSCNDKLNGEIVDVLDDNALKESIVRFAPDYIVNFVGSFTSCSLNEAIRLNVGVSNTICEAVIEANLKLKKILLIGSAAEYGYPDYVPISETAVLKPVNHYGLSKVMQCNAVEYYARVKKLPVSLARTFNIIGKGISNNLSIGAFVEKIKAVDDRGTITVGNLTAKRDFLDVRDVVSAYWNILQSEQSEMVYNVCRSESVSMYDIVRLMIDASGKDIHIEQDATLQKEHDVDDIYGDNRRLIKETEWSPRFSLEESINALLS